MLITFLSFDEFDQNFFPLKAVFSDVLTDAKFASICVNLRQNESFPRVGLFLLFVDRFSKFQREVISCDKKNALTQNLRRFASKHIILLNNSTFAVYGPIFKIPTFGDSL